MMTVRTVHKLFRSQPVLEGAGVRLKRAFGYREVPLLDPFLMLDDMHSTNPADYTAGFPWHPHRGIETITYLIQGLVEHSDSMGNKGTISSGEVQWMTAGSGIIHQEMPQVSPTGTMQGFQFWTNLPGSHKMMPPRYRDIKAADIPEVLLPGGGTVKVICGTVNGTVGPVKDIVSEPELLDVVLPVGAVFSHPVVPGHTALAYVIDGSGKFGQSSEPAKGQVTATMETVVLYERQGNQVVIEATSEPLRLLFLSGKPLEEPVAWRGPIVMNTEEELRTAFAEYHNGTFVKG